MICRANQWTGFYMIGTSVKKESTRVMCSQSYIKFCVRSNIVIFLFIFKFFFFHVNSFFFLLQSLTIFQTILSEILSVFDKLQLFKNFRETEETK